MKPVLIFGCGQVAQVFSEYLSAVSFVVDEEYRSEETIAGLPVVPFGRVTDLYRPDHYEFVTGMSFKGLNKPRAEKFEMMCAKGYTPHTFCFHDVWLPNSATICAGSFIMDRNTIQPGVEIGENCVLWSGNHVGHHSRIGSHVWISSGVTISGAVEIGDYCFIGSGVTIADGVKIGSDCIIGAGSLILHDCPYGGVYQGIETERSRVPSSRMRGVWAHA